MKIIMLLVALIAPIACQTYWTDAFSFAKDKQNVFRGIIKGMLEMPSNAQNNNCYK